MITAIDDLDEDGQEYGPPLLPDEYLDADSYVRRRPTDERILDFEGALQHAGIEPEFRPTEQAVYPVNVELPYIPQDEVQTEYEIERPSLRPLAEDLGFQYPSDSHVQVNLPDENIPQQETLSLPEPNIPDQIIPPEIKERGTEELIV